MWGWHLRLRGSHWWSTNWCYTPSSNLVSWRCQEWVKVLPEVLLRRRHILLRLKLLHRGIKLLLRRLHLLWWLLKVLNGCLKIILRWLEILHRFSVLLKARLLLLRWLIKSLLFYLWRLVHLHDLLLWLWRCRTVLLSRPCSRTFLLTVGIVVHDCI